MYEQMVARRMAGVALASYLLIAAVSSFGGLPHHSQVPVEERPKPTQDKAAMSYMQSILSYPSRWTQAAVFIAKQERTVTNEGEAAKGFIVLRVTSDFGDVAVPRMLVVPADALRRRLPVTVAAFEATEGGNVIALCPPAVAKPSPIYVANIPAECQDILKRSLARIRAFRGGKSVDEKGQKARALLDANTDICAAYLGRYLASQKVSNSKGVAAGLHDELLAKRDSPTLGLLARAAISEGLAACDAEYRKRREHTDWLRKRIAERPKIGFRGWEELLTLLYKYTTPSEIVEQDLPLMLELLDRPEAVSEPELFTNPMLVG